MKILSRLLVISMCLLSLNISNAQTANFMTGEEVFEYFKNLPYWYQAIFIGVVSAIYGLKGADIMRKK